MWFFKYTCAASVWTKILRFCFPSSPLTTLTTSPTGCITPVSLLANIRDMRIVVGRRAAVMSAGDTAPVEGVAFTSVTSMCGSEGWREMGEGVRGRKGDVSVDKDEKWIRV